MTHSPAALAEAVSGGWWLPSRHLLHVNEALLDVAAGVYKRLVIELPPGTGKSELAGHWFPAWFLGTFPDRRVAYVNYGADLAWEFGGKVRNTLTQHGSLFGVSVAHDSKAADRWNIAGRRGGMYAVGYGGPITGRRLHLMVIDDPVKNAEEAMSEVKRESLWNWLQGTALKQMEPGAPVVMIMHRWHDDDLIGRFKRAHPDCRCITLPALAEDNDPIGRPRGQGLWPEKWPQAEWEELQRVRPMYWWLALYQQRPGQGIGTEWPREYFEGEDFWFDRWPLMMPIRVIALDPSMGKSKHSDYSAFVMLGIDQRGHHWVEADLQRRPPGQTVADGVEHWKRFAPHGACVETRTFQELYLPMFAEAMRRQALRDAWGNPGEWLPLDNSERKENRIRRIDPVLRGRTIHFRKTPGTELLVQQLREFPLGKHDDGPDALEMAGRLMMMVGEPIERVPSQMQIGPEYR